MSDEKLKLAFEKLARALVKLEQMAALPLDLDRAYIDSTIHRFEFVIELFWKLLKKIIEDLGQEVNYPREVIQEAFAGHLINDEKIWLQMLLDRNLTSHTYNEKLADDIYAHIKTYLPVLRGTFDDLNQRYG